MVSPENATAWGAGFLKEHAEAERCVSVLTRARPPLHGCDRDHLVTLLHRVSRSRSEKWDQISKEDLRDMILHFRRVVCELETISQSERRRQILPSEKTGDLDVLRKGIQGVLNRLRAVAPKADKRHTPRTDSAIADVIRYVQQSTGKPHDHAVGSLLTLVFGEKRNMKRWRQLHADVL